MKAKPELSIITVNYNGADDTCDFIRSVIASHLEFSYELIVVDNGSIQDEAQLLKEVFPFIDVIRSDANLGFAGGNNLGLKSARGEFVYFLNNDTLLSDDASTQIQDMIETLRLNSSIGGISPKIMFVDPPDTVQFAGSTELSSITLRNYQIGYMQIENGSFDKQKSIPYLHGAAMLIPRRVISDIGMLPECYFLYYEEIDWSCMIRRKYDLVYFPRATVYHKESASTGIDSPFKTYFLTRNRLIYAFRNRHGWRRLASIFYQIFIAGSMHAFKFIIRGQASQSKAILKGILEFLKFVILK